jgi:hypothetical protein
MSAGTSTEKDVAAACDAFAELLGWRVERYEQQRATRIAEGLPDRRYVHDGRRLRVWVELKRPGGKLTAAQYRWLLTEWHAGAHATACDTLDSFRAILSLLGRDAGRGEALRKCREFIDLAAARGFRAEPSARKRPTKRAA